MKFDDYGIEGKRYWQYVDELDGRGLNLSYPTSVVKAIKQLFYDIGDEGIQDEEKFILYIHRRDGGGRDTSYYDILSPSATFHSCSPLLLTTFISASPDGKLGLLLFDHTYCSLV